ALRTRRDALHDRHQRSVRGSRPGRPLARLARREERVGPRTGRDPIGRMTPPRVRIPPVDVLPDPYRWRMERKLTAPVLIAIAVTVIAWASAFVVIRGTQVDISGGALALGRLIVGFLLLTIPFAVSRKWVRPTWREWLMLLGFGGLWFGVYN